MSENHFAKALHNFTMDVACNDAIKALCDKGYTLEKIKETLTFPAKEEHIAKIMWEHMLSKGTVLFDNFSDTVPAQTPLRLHDQRSCHIIETRDRYGRKSFLRVKKESPEVIFSPEDYVQYENFLVLKRALEQVSSLSGHIPLKDRSTGSHPDM